MYKYFKYKKTHLITQVEKSQVIKRQTTRKANSLEFFFSTVSFININHLTTTCPDSLQLFLDMHLTLPTARKIHRNPEEAKNIPLSRGQIYKYSIYVYK